MGSSASYMINNLVGTMSFYVTCVNSSGSTTSDSVVVSVVPSNLPVITAFVASPSNVVYGQSTTLSWSTMNVAAGGCSIGALGLSGLPGMGSYMTGPLKATATYTLSCTNSNGDVVSQSVTVVVNDVVVEPPYNI
jgi:hypothetical protein